MSGRANRTIETQFNHIQSCNSLGASNPNAPHKGVDETQQETSELPLREQDKQLRNAAYHILSPSLLL